MTLWKKHLCPLLQDLWPLNFTGCWRLRGGSARKRLNRHWILVFILFFFLVSAFGRTGKSYFQIFVQLLLWQYDKRCAFNPFPLEVNSNGRLKQEHLEFFSSVTKNIISPLPQCLWPPSLTGWWHTMRGSHP